MNDDQYPEFPLAGRNKKAFLWTPDGVQTLLDAGCAWGYGTRFFTQKSEQVFGLEPDEKYIEIAQNRYPDLEFTVSPLEQTPFPDQFFDVIIACDTLEHAEDEVQCFSEMFRILKPQGLLIVTTPHQGVFAFLDPANALPYLEYFVKRYLGIFYKLAYWVRKRKFPEEVTAEKPIYTHENTHRHYTKEDFIEFLNQSEAKGRYDILKVFRSGLLLGVLTHNIEFYISLFFPVKVKRVLEKVVITPLNFLAELDYWIPYHRLAYNIALKIRKIE
ncbi:class I SAM-dependent methyltransferase [Spirulina sp. CS-785/01]|uniref:class I SAM-dependent methyltransferase n=1 Tax=Spirulina sp. CS-785/01 TaxID=3021716 RepID=UPI00232D957A|nr:class I SAM-dependent methyltransferase [Spirulina sp. CS-785/01]MDB9311905.1 class I SAM-dependent methyltransferase [Spirulina sp. CS-785/01]